MKNHFIQSVSLVCVSLFLALSVNCRSSDDNEQETLLGLLLLVYLSDPCNQISSPLLTSAQATNTSALGSGEGNMGVVRGRVTTSSGSSVVAANIAAEPVGSPGTSLVSTYSSVNRDGTFLLSGIPAGTNYRIAVEPIDPEFDQRIDTHIDCFQSPKSFTSVWIPASGSEGTSFSTGARSFNVSAGETLDTGTISLSE